MQDATEIKYKRQAREKHFLKKDGTMIAEVYSADIHFLKNGRYEEIDNTLIPKEHGFVNRYNAFETWFFDHALCKIKKGHHQLTITLKDRKEQKAIVQGKNVIYHNVLENIDLQYQVFANKVKEAILLRQPTTLSQLTFLVETDLLLTLKANGEIDVSDGKQSLFTIDKPYMIDHIQNRNDRVFYRLNPIDKGYELECNLDRLWLQNATYPVMIDPTITNIHEPNSVIDTYIYPGDTQVNRNQEDKLKIGVTREGTTDIPHRALIKFALPKIGTGSQIIKAYAHLIGYPDTKEFTDLNYRQDMNYYDVHQVTTDWQETTANWETMNHQYEARIEDFGYLWRSKEDLLHNILQVRDNMFNITNLVKKWYSGTPNYGIMIKAHTEVYTDDIPLKLCFSNNVPLAEGSDDPKPFLTIHYRNQNGIEPYLNYQTQELTDGTFYHNLYNGNLTSVFPLGDTAPGKYPAGLSLVYNTNDVVLENDFGYGLGFQWNLCQTIRPVTIGENNLLEYRDGDGTLHYFYKGSDLNTPQALFPREENLYYDEDGLSLSIEQVGEVYHLKDKDGNKKYFTKQNREWILTELVNTADCHITVDYQNGRIGTVTDANGETISLTYEENRTVITTPRETVTLEYRDRQVTSITTKNGTTHFTYHPEKIIDTVTDSSGQKLFYEYYDTIPYRVKRIGERGLDGTLGKYANIQYGFEATTICDEKNHYQTYTFNTNGNTECITSLGSREEVYHAYGKMSQYGEKILDNVFGGSLNKLVYDQEVVKTVKNYIPNSGYELETPIPFSDEDITDGITTLEKASGIHSFQITSLPNKQKIYSRTVPKGKYYTFSAFLKSDVPFLLELEYQIGDSVTSNRAEVLSSPDFLREQVTIFYPLEATGDLRLKITCLEEGTIFLDDVQLEEGEVANAYNYLYNGDFSEGLSPWEITAEITALDSLKPYITIPSEQFVTLENGSTALKIKGDPNVQKTLSLKVPLGGMKGDCYDFYFWFKNCGIESGVSEYSRRCIVQFDYTEEGMGTDIPPGKMFNINNDEWQFFAKTFCADRAYRSFTIFIFEHDNVNDLYLTNFSLFKKTESRKYRYDNNGNVIESYDPFEKESKFKYDQNNQLIAATDVKGINFVYEYDQTVPDRILSGISPTGIANQIRYDSFGNPLVTRTRYVGTLSPSIYHIRLSKTDDYIATDFTVNRLTIFSTPCSKEAFQLIQKDTNYQFQSLENPRYYWQIFRQQLVLGANPSAFELLSNPDGSYRIKWVEKPLYVTRKDQSLILGAETEAANFYLEDSLDDVFIEKRATYTEDGRYLLTVTDSLEHTITYHTDPISGLVDRIEDPTGNKTEYFYTPSDQLSKVVKGNKQVEYFYNDQLKLSKIKSGSKQYQFFYDEFLNTKQIEINHHPLITNIYKENDGNLWKSIYGNGDTIVYEYDEYDRVTQVTKENDQFRCYYDHHSNLTKVNHKDHEYRYYYDLSNRLIEYRYDDFRARFCYQQNNLEEEQYYLGNDSKSLLYDYNEEDAIRKITFDNGTLLYLYDNLGRIKEKVLNDNYRIQYKYVSNGKKTSPLLKSITNGEDRYQYTYDKLGNIIRIYYNDILKHAYTYDEDSELLSDYDYERNIRVEYTYDLVGNLQSKKEYHGSDIVAYQEVGYEYQNPDWEDQLTKFADDAIMYDPLGNPLTIGNKTLTWTNGRQLATYQEGDFTVTYHYNPESIRTGKTVNNEETKYYLKNNAILFEQKGNRVIYYIRDSERNLIGLEYQGATYYYLKSGQGDIVALVDSEYQVVARYTYDAWGDILSITDQLGNDIRGNKNHIANINPFRYRGYYYDVETNLYYLNSRYYNPVWGRFLNMDSYGGEIGGKILSHNVYAYGLNNPITNYDSEGLFVLTATLATTGLAFVGAIATYYATKAVAEVVLPPIHDALSTSYYKPREKVKTEVNSKAITVTPYAPNINKDKPCTTAKINIRTNDVDRGWRLTIKESHDYVQVGGSVMCDDEASAEKVAMTFGEYYFHYHNQGTPGYYPHFHPRDGSPHRHIWYLEGFRR